MAARYAVTCHQRAMRAARHLPMEMRAWRLTTVSNFADAAGVAGIADVGGIGHIRHFTSM